MLLIICHIDATLKQYFGSGKGDGKEWWTQPESDWRLVVANDPVYHLPMSPLSTILTKIRDDYGEEIKELVLGWWWLWVRGWGW